MTGQPLDSLGFAAEIERYRPIYFKSITFRVTTRSSEVSRHE